MKKLRKVVLLLVAGLIIFASCKKDPIPDPDPDPEPEVVQITSFVFSGLNPQVTAQIDQQQRTINALIPRTANLNNLLIEVEFTEGATLSPPSGFAYNFGNPLEFSLIKGAQLVKYMVTVGYAESAENQLLQVSFPDLFRKGEIAGNQVALEVPFGTNLQEINVNFQVSDHATVSPVSGSTVNLSSPLNITVTAENGETNQYTLTTSVLPQETGVRAFWIPDPSHTPFLSSLQGIQNGVALAKELNFNTLFVCAWAKTRTFYPSQVLADNSTYTDARDGMFTPNYFGLTNDPLADLITVAHAEGLKVILWYEYGFMARWGSAPTPANDKILAVNPHWVGINSSGQAANYNNSDFYYNGYNPEVQQFMIDLVMEAVNNYNIDGIQGDDRMPAAPRNSGYEEYTINRYKAEHGGAEPPSNFNNTAWVRWRVNILNKFGQDLFNAVKAAKPNVLVTNSPNPYPWAFNNLMQEWPVWLDAGNVEILSVQCYRYTISAYRSTVNEVLSYFTNHGDGNLQRLSPGIILYGSAGLTDPDLIAEKMLYNRTRGITGESFFYDNPLNDHRIKRVIKAFYPGPAFFPNF